MADEFSIGGGAASVKHGSAARNRAPRWSTSRRPCSAVHSDERARATAARLTLGACRRYR